MVNAHYQKYKASYAKYYASKKFRAALKRYKESNKGISMVENRKKDRLKLIDLLGGKCVVCGFSDYRALQIDHKLGGGQKQIEQMGDHYFFVRHYLANNDQAIKDLQVLCANHNWIKRWEMKEWRKAVKYVIGEDENA